MAWPKGRKRSEQDKQRIRDGMQLAIAEGRHYSPFSDCTAEQYAEWQAEAKDVREALGHHHVITAEERGKGHARRGCTPGGTLRSRRASFDMSVQERRELLKDPCVYCNGKAEEADHIRPYSKGGSHDWINRAPTCFTCNRAKNNLGVLQFLIKRQRAA